MKWRSLSALGHFCVLVSTSAKVLHKYVAKQRKIVCLIKKELQWEHLPSLYKKIMLLLQYVSKEKSNEGWYTAANALLSLSESLFQCLFPLCHPFSESASRHAKELAVGTIPPGWWCLLVPHESHLAELIKLSAFAAQETSNFQPFIFWVLLNKIHMSGRSRISGSSQQQVSTRIATKGGMKAGGFWHESGFLSVLDLVWASPSPKEMMTILAFMRARGRDDGQRRKFSLDPAMCIIMFNWSWSTVACLPTFSLQSAPNRSAESRCALGKPQAVPSGTRFAFIF